MKNCLAKCYEIKVFPELEIIQFPDLEVKSTQLLFQELLRSDIKHGQLISLEEICSFYYRGYSKILLLNSIDLRLIMNLSFFDFLLILKKINSIHNLKAFW